MSILIGEYDFWRTGDTPRILEVEFIQVPKDHSKQNEELVQYFTEEEIESYMTECRDDELFLCQICVHMYAPIESDYSEYDYEFDMQKFEDHLLFLDRDAPELLRDMIIHSKQN